MDERRERSPPGQWRLLGPALGTWGVVAWVIGMPGSARWVGFGAAIVGTAVIAICTVNTHRSSVNASRRTLSNHRHGATDAGGAKPERLSFLRYAAIACAMLVMLGTRIDGAELARASPELLSAAEGQRSVELSVVLRSFPESTQTAFDERAWARAATTLSGGEVPLLLWLPEQAERNWAPGTDLIVRGTPETLEAGASAAYALSVRRVEPSAGVGGEPRAGRASPAELAGNLAAELRMQLCEATERVRGAELVAGFTVGDTSQVPDELDEQMIDSSLTHLTAVSGANCALVTGAVMALAAYAGAGRRLRTVLAGGGLAGFVVVVGPDASVQRAAVMATVILISGFGGKRAKALPALGLAIFVLLLADPWQARQPGFTLSVAATAGILLLAPLFERGLRRVPYMPRAVALPIAVALSAQLACGPLLLFLQSGIPAVGVLANVLAAPAAPVGTGFGLLAMLTLPVWEPFGQLCVVAASWATRWVAAIAEVTSALPFARWPWPEGWPGALLLAACQLAALLAWALVTGRVGLPRGARVSPRPPWQRRRPRPRSVRITATMLLSGAVGTVLAGTVVTPIAERVGVPSRWSVVACDIGQGDAFLLRSPDTPEEIVLVDTGDEPELLTACLRRFSVTRISLLVLSHDDQDHVGALDVVLPMTEAALIAPPTHEQLEFRPVAHQLAAAGVLTTVGFAGTRGDGAGVVSPSEDDTAAGLARTRTEGLGWEVIAPEPGTLPADPNAASLVMRVWAGETSVLLLGDTGENEHRRLLQQPESLEADILKVAHHGSGDQDPRLLAATNAQFGLISVGASNSYGHPHPDVLTALTSTDIRPLRTDQYGTIAMSERGGELDVWVEYAAGEGREGEG